MSWPRHIPDIEERERIAAKLRGHEVSEETRRKIGAAGKGRTPWNKDRRGVYTDEQLSRIAKGTRRGMIGWKPSAVHRESIRRAMQMRWDSGQQTIPHGSAHGNWKGGNVLDGWTYGQWRTTVFERDKHTCQNCGRRGGRLEADHIIPKWQAPELIYVVANGRTLCKSCHRKTKTFGWKAANTRGREYQLPLPLLVAA